MDTLSTLCYDFFTTKNQQKVEASTLIKNTTSKQIAQDKVFEIRVRKLPGYVPPEWYQGRFKDCGEFLTEVTTENLCYTHVKRISATQYEVVATGKIRNYMPSSLDRDGKYRKRRADLWRGFENLKAILRKNFPSGEKNALFITLTYREPQFCQRALKDDFNSFVKRLKRAYPHFSFEYVSIVEPHGSGAWHIHLLLKAIDAESLYIPHEHTFELWGNGFTDTRRLKSDDVGRYYAAYFTGLVDDTLTDGWGQPLSSEETYKLEKALAETGDLLPKKYLKGARLSFYPKGSRLYRCSSGIVRPEAYTAIRGNDSPELVNEFSKAFQIEKRYLVDSDKFKSGDVEVLNRVYKATYRRKEAVETASSLWSENCVIKAKEHIYIQESFV